MTKEYINKLILQTKNLPPQISNTNTYMYYITKTHYMYVYIDYTKMDGLTNNIFIGDKYYFHIDNTLICTKYKDKFCVLPDADILNAYNDLIDNDYYIWLLREYLRLVILQN